MVRLLWCLNVRGGPLRSQASHDNLAEKLFGHAALGWGVHIRGFLYRHEAAPLRLLCKQLLETVDSRWTFPAVRRLRCGCELMLGVLSGPALRDC